MKRKEFLKLSTTALLGGVIGGFPINVLRSAASPLMQALNNNLDNDHVLVLVQLNGGNDGLNTLIPLEYYSEYYNARSNVAIPQNQVLDLDGTLATGLHPVMQKMQQMYTEERLGMIQAVGYPDPNFSHFRATDIWMSASNSDQVVSTGWAGRFLDHIYPGFPDGYPNTDMPDPLAIQIGSSANLTCQGPVYNMAMSVTDPTNFYNLVNGDTGPVPNTNAGEELEYLRTVSQQTNQYGDAIVDAANNVTQQYSGYPANNPLAEQLKIVAQLIKGGLKTRIYMVSLGGFDTHAQQVVSGNPATGVHAELLSTVSEAIYAFQEDLKFLDIEERVLGMTYSEFGRRILSNASLGTDHGSGAPMFLFGSNVNKQILGDNPVIPQSVGLDDNIPFQYDFRSVYATILEKWFCLDPLVVEGLFPAGMNTTLQTLPLLKDQACNPVAINEPGYEALQLQAFPNPFTTFLDVRFETSGGRVILQLIDNQGRVLKHVLEKTYTGNSNDQVRINTDDLPNGMYYIRFQNGMKQQTLNVMKVR